jgi:hypothetical protein
MIGLKGPRFRNSLDWYKFEHGPQSMTQRLPKNGLEPLIVGRDGRAYGELAPAISHQLTRRLGPDHRMVAGPDRLPALLPSNKVV